MPPHAGFFADPETWVAVAVLIFIVLFGRKFWAATTKALDRRSAGIRADLDEAARLRAEAEAMLRQAQAEREAAMREAQALLDGAGAEAARAAAQARAEAEAGMQRRERMAAERIKAAEAAALTEVRRVAAEVATQAATQLMSAGLGAETEAALVDRAIAGLPAALTGRRAA